jgi:hypothetical protein
MGLACPDFERIKKYLRPLNCPEEDLAVLHGELRGNGLAMNLVIANILHQMNPTEGLAVLWSRSDDKKVHHLIWAFDGNVFGLWAMARNMQRDEPPAYMDYHYHGPRHSCADIAFPGTGKFDLPAFYAVNRNQLVADLLPNLGRGLYELLFRGSTGMFYSYLPSARAVLKSIRHEQERDGIASADAAEQDCREAA